MSEVSAQSLDRRQLLLADGEFSLSALQRSLKAGGGASEEASLHVMDLSSLLASFGLRAPAQILKGLAQNLADDPMAFVDPVQAVLSHLKSLMQALQADQTDVIQAASQALVDAVAASAQRTPEPIAPAPAPTQAASFVAADAAQVLPDLDGRWSEPAPFFSAGLNAAPYAAVAPKQASALPVPPAYEPSWTELRAQVLHTVQDAGLAMLPAGQAGEAVTATVLKLNAVQDALVRVGQLPLRSVLRDTDGADEVWLDQSLLTLVDDLQVFSQRANRITLQLRNLTVFIHWQGGTLSQVELDHIGQKVDEAGGRVELLEGGVQLVLPVSTQRMRMVSYRQSGEWHAVSQAQFMGWDNTPSSCRLKLRCGVREVVLPVQESGPVSNMNLHPWPTLVPAPVSLLCVAIDGAGRVHQVHQHSA